MPIAYSNKDFTVILVFYFGFRFREFQNENYKLSQNLSNLVLKLTKYLLHWKIINFLLEYLSIYLKHLTVHLGS